MPASESLIIEGDVDIYIGATDAALPAEIATTSTGLLTFDPEDWTYLGFKNGGVKLTYERQVTDKQIDEAAAPVGEFLERESCLLEFNLVQASSDILALSANGQKTTIAAGASVTGRDTIKVGGAKPTIRQLVLHGLNDLDFYILWNFYRVSIGGNIEYELMRARQLEQPFRLRVFADPSKDEGEQLFQIINMRAVPTS